MVSKTQATFACGIRIKRLLATLDILRILIEEPSQFLREGVAGKRYQAMAQGHMCAYTGNVEHIDSGEAKLNLSRLLWGAVSRQSCSRFACSVHIYYFAYQAFICPSRYHILKISLKFSKKPPLTIWFLWCSNLKKGTCNPYFTSPLVQDYICNPSFSNQSECQHLMGVPKRSCFHFYFLA